MNLPRYAVQNPVVIGVIAVAMLAAGLFAIATTPSRLQPYVESPAIGIEIAFPGMSAEDMATFFAEPIEKQVEVVKGVQDIRSTSQEGHTEIALVFPYGTDMKRALTETESLVNSFLNSIPQDRANATIPWVVHIDQNNIPILDFAVSRPGWDPVRLREFASNTLHDRFQQVPGVQSVIVWGGKRRQVQIVVDRTKVAAYGLSILDVKQRIDQFMVSRAAGRTTNPHGDWLVRINDAATERRLPELERVPVGMTHNSVVYLRDVATVKDTYAEERSAYHYDGHAAILVSIVQVPDAATPAVVTGAEQLARQLETAYPGLHLAVAFNQNDYISLIIHNAARELVLALLITSLVVLLFLRDLRSTFIVFVTLPTSVLFGLFLFRPWGITINTPSIVGFIFVLGRLVDDSVILLDVVHRRLKRGESPRDAAVNGAGEVMTALIATSLSFWAALLPLSFLGGSMGAMFADMNIPMVMANIGSTFLALTLNPLMAAHLFKHVADERASTGQRVVDWITAPVDRGMAWLERVYRRTLELSIEYRLVALALAVVSVFVAAAILRVLPEEMVPGEDTGISIGQVAAPPGTPFPKFERMVSRVEQIVQRQRDTNGTPVVEKVSTLLGQEPQESTYFTGYGLPDWVTATLKITYTPSDTRRLTIWQLQDRIVAQVRQQVPGVRYLWFKEMGATPVATARSDVEVSVLGPRLAGTYALGQRLLQVAYQVPGPTMIYPNMTMTEPQLRIVVDQTRAAELGLPPLAIAQQAYYALQGGFTGQFFQPAEAWRQSRILIRYAGTQRIGPQDIGQVMLTLPGGRQIPLKSVARVEWTRGADYIVRKNQQYDYTVFAEYNHALGLQQTVQNLVMNAMQQLAPLPQGYTVAPSGVMPEMMDSMARLNQGLLGAVGLIFLYLVFQYRSVAMSLVMMTAIPLEAVGAMIFLYARHLAYSTLVLWGLEVLVGIVLSNGILLIDRAVKNEQAGMTPREAILEAGPTRLRPILMTALATMAAWVPFMFWPPTGMQKFKPIATGMVGGMVGNIFMTLVIIPALYILTHELVAFFRSVYLEGAPAAAPPERGRTAPAHPRLPAPGVAGGSGGHGRGEGEA